MYWLEVSERNTNKLFPFGWFSDKSSSLAEMELRLLIASFFLRFKATIDSFMKESDMFMYDTFNMSPIGKKLLVSLGERK